MKRCHYCGPTDDGLRPYGPGGSLICFPCMKATPEREEAAAQAALALVDAAAAASPFGAAVLTKDGPQPLATDPAEVAGGPDRTSIIVLDRIEPGGPELDYCTHGRATCAGGCNEWVWLGSETIGVVQRGEASPLCKQCAERLVPRDGGKLIRRVVDHRRTDGRHT